MWRSRKFHHNSRCIKPLNAWSNGNKIQLWRSQASMLASWHGTHRGRLCESLYLTTGKAYMYVISKMQTTSSLTHLLVITTFNSPLITRVHHKQS